MKNIQQGCVAVWIDEIVPCLKDSLTGEIKETVVFKIESRKYLKEFQQANGWHIDWNKIPKDVEVYALALKDSHEIQGLIGVRNDKDSCAAYIHWVCVAPHNNKYQFGKQQYIGVGGHLFAIAIDKSMQWGYGGTAHGFAASEKLLKHYMEVFHADYLGMLHQYQFLIDEDNAKKIWEVYHYEWNEA